MSGVQCRSNWPSIARIPTTRTLPRSVVANTRRQALTSPLSAIVHFRPVHKRCLAASGLQCVRRLRVFCFELTRDCQSFGSESRSVPTWTPSAQHGHHLLGMQHRLSRLEMPDPHASHAVSRGAEHLWQCRWHAHVFSGLVIERGSAKRGRPPETGQASGFG